MKTKVIAVLIALFFVSTLIPNQLKACDIEFLWIKGKKNSYKTGDVIEVKMTMSLSHRVCQLSLNETIIEVSGAEIIASGEWEELVEGVYQKTFKLKVTIDSPKEHKLSVTRICNRSGGCGVFKF